MAGMFILTVLLSAVLSQCSASEAPDRHFGYNLIGNRSMDVFIDVFYDNICSDSAANCPMLLQLVNQDYLKGRLGVAINIFPLPYHHNSFFAAWAGETIKQTEPDKFIPYMRYIFSRYDDFISKAVELTEPEVQSRYASYVESATGIKSQTILDGFGNSDLNQRARLAWKYACSRGISGTPTFIVNDVIVPEASEFDLKQWNNFLSKLLG